MLRLSFRPTALAALVALTSGLLLSSCNSQPTATEADKTATVISSDTNEASDSTATTVPSDSAGAGASTSGQ